MKIGEKLKEGRDKKNMTQDEVSKIVNVSRSTVSSWEVNRTYPDLDVLVALSDLYDISLDDMLREDKEMVLEFTNEIKNSKKRKKMIIVISLIFIPLLFILGYQLWSSSLVISPDNIKNSQIEINGEGLNSESEILVTLEVGKFREYIGYWMETGEYENVVALQFYQKYSSSAKEKEIITIPVKLEGMDDKIKEKSIEIRGFNSSDSKVIYIP